jgi:predicted transcriptional regulator
MTLRLPDDQAVELEVVARANDMSVSEIVRDAITEHIERLREDADFQKRIKSIREREQSVFDRLAR